MATLTVNNSNKPTAMRLRLTYTAGSGNITISKIEGCRTDNYGDTTDSGTCSVKVKVGSTTKTYSKTGVYFKDNSEYTVILQQNISFDVTGTQSVNITFTSANSNISGSSFTTSINAGVKVPTLELGTGYDSSHRFTIPNASEGVSFYLGNTNGLTTYFQYYVGQWKNFTSRTANGWYGHTITSAQATEILTYLNNTANPNLQVRASNSNGSSSSIYLYLHVDDSIKPTLDSISVSAYCDVSGFENLFIKGLSKPIVTFNNPQGVQGSIISSYLIGQMTGDNRTDFVLSMTGNVSNTSNFNNLSVAGSNTISAFVKDSRSRNSLWKSQTFDVIDYNTPSLSSVSLERCLQDGTLDNDGEYALLKVNYKIYPVNDGTNNRNTKTLSYSLDNNNWVDLTITNWEDTITTVIGNGDFDTTQTYTIYIRLQDRTTTTIKNQQLSPSKRLRSLYHGSNGEGITLGRKASEPGFHDYLGATFHNGLVADNLNIPSEIIDIKSNKLLANPNGWFMNANQTVDLSENITDQTNGIILVWSAYSSNQPQNYWWNFTVVPKYWVQHNDGGTGVTCTMYGGAFASPCAKYVYVNNKSISGNAVNNQSGTANGITYNNAAYVLRYVVGF